MKERDKGGKCVCREVKRIGLVYGEVDCILYIESEGKIREGEWVR